MFLMCSRARGRGRISKGIWKSLSFWELNGARRRIRTTDTRIFNPLLYQLSYPGAGASSFGLARCYGSGLPVSRAKNKIFTLPCHYL